MACLYLGGKLEDTPKSAKDVIATCCSRRFDPGSSAGPRIHDAVGIQKGFVGCGVCMHRFCVCVCVCESGAWRKVARDDVHSVEPLLSSVERNMSASSLMVVANALVNSSPCPPPDDRSG